MATTRFLRVRSFRVLKRKEGGPDGVKSRHNDGTTLWTAIKKGTRNTIEWMFSHITKLMRENELKC